MAFLFLAWWSRHARNKQKPRQARQNMVNEKLTPPADGARRGAKWAAFAASCARSRTAFDSVRGFAVTQMAGARRALAAWLPKNESPVRVAALF
jgi:hypothetical protein